MSEAVREMSRQEMIDEMNRLREKLESYKTAFESAKTERDKIICEKAAEISRLRDESEKALKQIEHDQIKIAELINEIDCKRSEIMPDEPIKVADCLIHAKGTREVNVLQRIFGGNRRYESYDIYSVSDLKEIAEHLLAYCKNCEVTENDC